VQPCFQTTVTPQPTSAPDITPTAPSTEIPQGLFAHVSTVMLDHAEQTVSTAINASVAVGQYLFVRIAAVSMLFAIIGWYLSGEHLMGIVRALYWRIVEASLWLTLIAWTWKGPGGIPGWFPAIIGGIATIGGTIADQIAGTHLVSFVNTQFEFTILPGTILDLGSALFSAIATLAWNNFAGGGIAAPGLVGSLVNGAKTVVAIAGGALTGTLFASGIVYLLTILAAVYVYFVCAWIAFRYFLAVLKILTLGCLAFLQGLAGSRRLSTYAGGYLSIAIVLGSEFALTVIIIGIFYGVIMGIIQSTAIWPLVANVISVSGGITATPIAWTKTALSLGTLLFLDVLITVWAWSMHEVPKTVKQFFSGQLSISPQEAVRVAQASPTIGGKVMGMAGATVQSFATHGPAQTIAHTSTQLASFGLAGASSPHRGTRAGIIDGAFRGGALGGIPGAMAGAAGSWIAGRFVPNAPRDNASTTRQEMPNTEATDPTDATPETDAAQEGQEIAQNTPHPQKRPDAPSSQTSSASPTVKNSQSRASSSASRSSPTGEEARTASVSSKKFGEQDDLRTLRAESAKEWAEIRRKRLGLPDPQEILRDLERETRFGQILARTMAYAHQYQVTRAARPQQDESSAAIPTPNLHIGNR
jgi:hypothetical protein